MLEMETISKRNQEKKKERKKFVEILTNSSKNLRIHPSSTGS